ncbi:MAG TPA: hypothetical protein PLF13_11480 [candidate division Zixibacteria bacterium]|nr:hypothetical protein [candidate division Zixibacteria bacterium]
MTRARTILFGITIILLTMTVTVTAQEQPQSNIKPVDTLLAARQTYDSALTRNDSDQFARVAHLYLRMYRLLAPNNPSGLSAHYPTLQDKCAYRRGWCFYRMAELESNPVLFDSARTWFERVPRDAQDTVYWWSQIMTAEILGQQAVTEKYYLLDSLGTLPSEQATEIGKTLDQTDAVYAGILDPYQTPSDSAGERVLLAAQLRRLDLAYERARLKLAIGDTAGAAAIVRDLDYLSVKTGETVQDRDFESMTSYENASRLALLRLLSPSDQVAEMRFRDARKGLGADSLFWDATGRFLKEDYRNAHKLFGVARGLDEYSYWRSFAALLLVNAREFEHARDSFQTFYSRTERPSDYNSRLSALRNSAAHKHLVLQAASLRRNDKALPDENLQRLTAEDVKFLLRVGASFTNWLDNCLYRLDTYLDHYAAEAMDNDAVNFYAGMARTLEGHRDLDSSTYADAARILEKVGGNKYALEARYVAALDWVPGRNLDRAMELLEPLVEDNHSCRALFEIGHILNVRAMDDRGDCCRAAAIFTYLRDSVFTTNPEYVSFYNAIDGYTNYLSRRCSDCVQIVDFDRIDLDNYSAVICPDSLLIDTIGGIEQIVLYESLAKPDQIPLAFRQEFIRMMRVYGMPKKSVYIAAEDRVLTDSRFPERRYDGFALGIPDEPYIDANWHPVIEPVASEGELIAGLAPSFEARTVGKASPPVTDLIELPWISGGAEYSGETVPVNLIDSSGYIITHDSIQVQKVVELTAHASGFYPTLRRISCPDPRLAPFAFALSHRIELSESKADRGDRFNSWTGHRDYLAVLQDKEIEAPTPHKTLVEKLKTLPNWRDFAFDKIHNRYLVIDCEKTDRLIVYEGGSQSELRLSPDPTSNINEHLLSSPEGIAVDEVGNIYVADWGNNRIAVFNDSGMFICAVTKGGNDGQSPLLLPTRVAIQVDRKGVPIDQERYGINRTYRDRYIIVADHNGVYRYDSHGNFVERIIAPDSFSPSGYRALGVSGYGSATTMVLNDPRMTEPVVYTAK